MVDDASINNGLRLMPSVKCMEGVIVKLVTVHVFTSLPLIGLYLS